MKFYSENQNVSLSRTYGYSRKWIQKGKERRQVASILFDGFREAALVASG
jgi:hypothetical protein